MMRNKAGLVIITFLVITSPWSYKIFNESVLLGVLTVFLGYILFFYLLTRGQRLFYTAITLFFITFIILLPFVNKGLLKLSIYEEKILNQRHGYLAQELGGIYTNKYTLRFYKEINPYLYKLQGAVFANLDTNLYFFGNHPRERAGVGEFEKFIFILLPFFIIGIFLLPFKDLRFLTITVFVVLFSGIIRPDYILGPILFYPLIIATTAAGAYRCIKYF